MKQPLTARPSARLSGRIRVPGDKSISHRALILGALSTRVTRITGLLEAEDIIATARAVAALGAEVETANGAVLVKGQGVGGLRAPDAPLDFGNSGTGSRLMLGVVAGMTWKSNSPAIDPCAEGRWVACSRRFRPWACKPKPTRITPRFHLSSAAPAICFRSSTTFPCRRRR
jgi:hypothetical protein